MCDNCKNIPILPIDSVFNLDQEHLYSPWSVTDNGISGISQSFDGIVSPFEAIVNTGEYDLGLSAMAVTRNVLAVVSNSSVQIEAMNVCLG